MPFTATALLLATNRLLVSVGIDDQPFYSVEEIAENASSLVVAAFEALFQTRIPGIIRRPSGPADYARNAQLMVDNLRAMLPPRIEIPDTIDGTSIAGGDLPAIAYLISLLNDVWRVVHATAAAVAGLDESGDIARMQPSARTRARVLGEPIAHRARAVNARLTGSVSSVGDDSVGLTDDDARSDHTRQSVSHAHSAAHSNASSTHARADLPPLSRGARRDTRDGGGGGSGVYRAPQAASKSHGPQKQKEVLPQDVPGSDATTRNTDVSYAPGHHESRVQANGHSSERHSNAFAVGGPHEPAPLVVQGANEPAVELAGASFDARAAELFARLLHATSAAAAAARIAPSDGAGAYPLASTSTVGDGGGGGRSFGGTAADASSSAAPTSVPPPASMADLLEALNLVTTGRRGASYEQQPQSTIHPDVALQPALQARERVQHEQQHEQLAPTPSPTAAPNAPNPNPNPFRTQPSSNVHVDDDVAVARASSSTAALRSSADSTSTVSGSGAATDPPPVPAPVATQAAPPTEALGTGSVDVSETIAWRDAVRRDHRAKDGDVVTDNNDNDRALDRHIVDGSEGDGDDGGAQHSRRGRSFFFSAPRTDVSAVTTTEAADNAKALADVYAAARARASAAGATLRALQRQGSHQVDLSLEISRANRRGSGAGELDLGRRPGGSTAAAVTSAGARVTSTSSSVRRRLAPVRLQPPSIRTHSLSRRRRAHSSGANSTNSGGSHSRYYRRGSTHDVDRVSEFMRVAHTGDEIGAAAAAAAAVAAAERHVRGVRWAPHPPATTSTSEQPPPKATSTDMQTMTEAAADAAAAFIDGHPHPRGSTPAAAAAADTYASHSSNPPAATSTTVDAAALRSVRALQERLRTQSSDDTSRMLSAAQSAARLAAAESRRREADVLRRAVLRARAAKHERTALLLRTRRVVEDMARATLANRISRSSRQAAAASELLRSLAAQERAAAAEAMRAAAAERAAADADAAARLAWRRELLRAEVVAAADEAQRAKAQRRVAHAAQVTMLREAERSFVLEEATLLADLQQRQRAEEHAFVSRNVAPLQAAAGVAKASASSLNFGRLNVSAAATTLRDENEWRRHTTWAPRSVPVAGRPTDAGTGRLG